MLLGDAGQKSLDAILSDMRTHLLISSSLPRLAFFLLPLSSALEIWQLMCLVYRVRLMLLHIIYSHICQAGFCRHGQIIATYHGFITKIKPRLSLTLFLFPHNKMTLGFNVDVIREGKCGISIRDAFTRRKPRQRCHLYIVQTREGEERRSLTKIRFCCFAYYIVSSRACEAARPPPCFLIPNQKEDYSYPLLLRRRERGRNL